MPPTTPGWRAAPARSHRSFVYVAAGFAALAVALRLRHRRDFRRRIFLKNDFLSTFAPAIVAACLSGPRSTFVAEGW